MKRIISLLAIFFILATALCSCVNIGEDMSSGVSSNDGANSYTDASGVSNDDSSDVNPEESDKDESSTDVSLNISPEDLEVWHEETPAEKFERITAGDNYIKISELPSASGINLETVYSDMFCPHCSNCTEVFKSVPMIESLPSPLDYPKDETAPKKKTIEIFGKTYSMTYESSNYIENLAYVNIYCLDETIAFVSFDAETDKIVSITGFPYPYDLPSSEEEGIAKTKELVESLGYDINYDEFDYSCQTRFERKYAHESDESRYFEQTVIEDGFTTPKSSDTLEERVFLYQKNPYGIHTNEHIRLAFEPKDEYRDCNEISLRIYDYDNEIIDQAIEKARPYVDKIESIVLKNLSEYHDDYYEILGITKDDSIAIVFRNDGIYIESSHSIAVKRTGYSEKDKNYKGEIAFVSTYTKIG